MTHGSYFRKCAANLRSNFKEILIQFLQNTPSLFFVVISRHADSSLRNIPLHPRARAASCTIAARQGVVYDAPLIPVHLNQSSHREL
jgi:hypothetical protein